MDTMNKGDSRVIDRPVHEVSVSVGALIVAREGGGDNPVVTQSVYPGTPVQPGDVPVILFALEGTNYSVAYTDIPTNSPASEVEEEEGEEAPEGTDYTTWTVLELRDKAKELGLEGYSKFDKEELIEAVQDAR